LHTFATEEQDAALVPCPCLVLGLAHLDQCGFSSARQIGAIPILSRDKALAIVAINQNLAETVREPKAQRRVNAEMWQMRTEFAEQIISLFTAGQRAKAEKLTAEIPALRERLGLLPLAQPRASDAGR